jgi:hypothetical protein
LMQKAIDAESAAKVRERHGDFLDPVMLARAVGRLEGMSGGIRLAIDALMQYAENERFEEETGLGG